jgi:hypothetical protein
LEKAHETNFTDSRDIIAHAATGCAETPASQNEVMDSEWIDGHGASDPL